jgi:hypothetical protein
MPCALCIVLPVLQSLSVRSGCEKLEVRARSRGRSQLGGGSRPHHSDVDQLSSVVAHQQQVAAAPVGLCGSRQLTRVRRVVREQRECRFHLDVTAAAAGKAGERELDRVMAPLSACALLRNA